MASYAKFLVPNSFFFLKNEASYSFRGIFLLCIIDQNKQKCTDWPPILRRWGNRLKVIKNWSLFSAHIYNMGEKSPNHRDAFLLLTFTCLLSGKNVRMMLKFKFLQPNFSKLALECDWNSKISLIHTKFVFCCWENRYLFWKEIDFFFKIGKLANLQ